jgi:hypothetical protein
MNITLAVIPDVDALSWVFVLLFCYLWHWLEHGSELEVLLVHLHHSRTTAGPINYTSVLACHLRHRRAPWKKAYRVLHMH